MRVAIQGTHGSFSEAAARRRWPDLVTLPCREAKDVVAAVRAGQAEAGCLPIENSLIGSVTTTYDLLEEAFGDGTLRLTHEILYPVHHTIMAVPGSIFIPIMEHTFGIKVSVTPSDYGMTRFLADKGFVQQCFVTNEPFYVRREGANIGVLLLSDTGFSPYRVWYARRDFVAGMEMPPRVRWRVCAIRCSWILESGFEPES